MKKHRYLTIDKALSVLLDARAKMGGDCCLILSLSDSGIEDATVNSIHIVHDDHQHYVEIRVDHPSLPKNEKT